MRDTVTGIEFPTTLHIPSRFPLPTYTLLGVGVRKVSFLGIKVYSVGFYADLDSISRSATFDQKIRHVVESSSCVLRIVPTRATSYSHLRDGFMRALQARIILQKSRQLLTPDEETQIVSPLLKFKSIFPNLPLAKGTPLDILITTPRRTLTNSTLKDRELIVRDLGSISSNWLSQEFILAYFEGDGISPPLKRSVEERLREFGR
ncbi:chalcone isomerase [Hysterangium stoloniferum]|nr:chalcone isomerase [Hysterangium stoloniferum]